MGTFSDTVVNAWLDALCRNVSYANATVYVQLHVGAPGAAGTSNVAANTTRQQASFSAASGRAITNSGDVTWSNVPNTETYTDVTLWSASTNGTYLGQDTLSANAAMVAGDTFKLAAGDLDLTLT
jgi:hypothetical protein